MTSVLEQQLEALVNSGQHDTLKGILHGIEKEGLRVTPEAKLAQTSHPESLGSALTNGQITTDYSEALLEFITPVFEKPEDALHYLQGLHQFTYRKMDDELIWSGSMPCNIPSAKEIPIARYGSSNIGRLKHIYRVGLEHRYGKMMQTIAGIHYNFSLPEDFWKALQQLQNNTDSLQTFRSASYFKLIRNFRRYSWLLLYLFGASPALCRSFMEGKEHHLEELHENTLYLPYATSLRMSDLGYSNKAQASLNICFNHLSTYVSSLHKAINTSYTPYEEIGVKVDGEYRQINTNILQIENEYYSDIRPKRVAESGETPTEALQQRGVEYVEVRNTDINPFLPSGIDVEQARFLDAFLITCLLREDTEISQFECDMISDNLTRVVNEGRKPGLRLETLNGDRPLTELGADILEQVSKTAGLLDQVHQGSNYQASVTEQKKKLEDSSLTPSAQVLAALKETGLDHTRWLLEISKQHQKTLAEMEQDSQLSSLFEQTVKESLEKQKAIESQDTMDFDQFIADYQ